jgi:hypothetical protein
LVESGELIFGLDPVKLVGEDCIGQQNKDESADSCLNDAKKYPLEITLSLPSPLEGEG